MQIRRRPPNPSVKVANLEYAIPHNDAKPKNILEEIVWEKDKEIDLAKNKVSISKLKKQIENIPPTKDFYRALVDSKYKPSIIAEIKKASPSKGIIRENFDPVLIAKSYEEAGASCLSVLTDKCFFQGGFNILVKVRKSVSLPILCKDFILSPYQIYLARSSGADAILLIASILSDQDLTYLKKVAIDIGLHVLVEVHNSNEMDRVLNLGGFPLIGINNRDLSTFKTDIKTTKIIASKYLDVIHNQKSIIISESGLFTRGDLQIVKEAGARSVLVGEALMRKQDVSRALKDLLS